MTSRSRLQNRIELLGTCAMIAATIAIAHSSESFAQSALQGTPTVAAGDAGVNRLGPSGGAAALDTISLNSQTAIINWTTFDQTTNTPINFLPQNTVARFQSANQDFVVLNRVFAATPGQAISINGTVQSLNFVGQTTGNVWFYSPGGIIAGPTSVFNVGSLILTADDIDTTGGLFGANNTIRFRGGAGSTAAVTVQPGAQFNLSAANSYLALVAPQVIMGGTATVNGSAAYIAAEQVDVRINGGAFDIAFVTGTGVANALTHSGTTTGPAAANGTIAMAVMPKNTAITMLVGGTVGYTPAATATIQNGTVVLSAGQDVVFGTIGQTPSTATANLTIGSGTFNSQVNAQATNIVASPNGGGPLAFTGNVNLTGLTSAELRADTGETITVGGDLALVSRRTGVGGTARLIVDGVGSQITVNGVTRIDASAFGALNFAGAGGDAVGGTAEVVARQGNMFLGTTFVTANGTGGYGTTRSGNGTGGIARARSEQTRSFGLSTGDLTISAFGQGGQGGGQFPQSPIGGSATGGQALFELANQGFASAGFLTIVANANGGTGGTSGGTGGNATAGTARIDMGTGSLSAGQTIVSANEQSGFAGLGGTTGSTSGAGIARVQTQSGTIRLDGLNMTADARTASGVRDPASAPAVEGALRAGTAEVLANLGSISVPNLGMSVSASAYGAGSSFATTAGSVTGGTINVRSTGGGSITSLGIFLQSLAFGTATTTTPGNATAGAVNLSNSGGSGFFLDPDDNLHDIRLDAYAVGASGPAPASATGGQITIDFSEGRARGVQTIGANATGFAGSSTTGGNGAPGRGGSVDFTLNPGSDIIADSVELTADGTTIDEREGLIGPGPGSPGFGGIVTANLFGGTLTTNSFRLAASGRGSYAFAGSGTPGTFAGTGSGGTATFTVDGATVSAGTVGVMALGTGGRGDDGLLDSNINASAGGVGIGGAATLQLSTGTLTTNTVDITANGVGGAGGFGDGVDGATGGSGTGGTATFRNLAGTSIATNAVNVRADGTGGAGGKSDFTTGSTLLSFNGGNGGAGTGGTALIDWQGEFSGSGNPPSLVASTIGTGADGGDGFNNASAQTGTFGGQGGDARGGSSSILISGTSTQFASIAARASAEGGEGAVGNATRRGGDATGGTAEVRVADAPLVVGVLDITSTAEAGTTRTGSFVAGARGADATGGSSLLEVSGANGSYVAASGGQYAYAGTPVFTMSADAYATNGVDGRSGTTGGAAGRGGNGTGGQVTVRVRDGLIDLGSPTIVGMYVDAVGGNAGNGGNASTYQPTGGGAGGDAGTGTGGSISFTADGGRLILGNLALTASANAGSAGYGGTDAGRPAIPGTPASPGIPATPGIPAIPSSYGGFGTTSFGQGGTITIESLSGSISGQDSRITGGNVTGNVAASTTGYGNFGYAGSVSVTNLNTGGAALQLGSLTVDAGPPNTGFFSGSTTLTANGSPITVAGDIRVTGSTSVYVQTSGSGFVTATGNVDLNVQGYIGVDQSGTAGQPALKAASITAAAGYGITTSTALIGADTDMTLSSAFGSITTGALTAGRDIRVTVDSGNIVLGPITAGRNAVIYGSPTISPVTVGTTTVGGYLEARGATLSFGDVTAATDAILSTFNGRLTVGNVTAGDDIFLTVNGSFANPEAVSPDSQTGQTSSTVNPLVAGNLRSTGLGSDTAASGPATFGTAAGPTGNVIRVRASGATQAGSITTGGTAIVVSDLSSIATGSISAPGGVGLYVRGNATVGNITTAGTFWLGDSSQVFGFVPNYTVTNFAPYQTPTSSGATLGAVQAGLIRGSVLTNTTYGSIAATGDLLWSTGNSNIIGGNVTGGALTTGGTMTVFAGGSVGFTTATPQGSALLIASTGAVTGTAIVGQSSIDVSAGTAITIPTVTTPGSVNLGAALGDVRVATNLQSADIIASAGQSIFLRSPGAINASSLFASAGTIDVAAAGNLVVGQARALGNIALTSTANLTADTVDAGFDAALRTSGFPADATLTGANVATGTSVTSGRLLTINATGTATINGAAQGRSETAVNSADIVVTAGATLGGTGNRLTLTNTGAGATFIGDVTGTGGWRLDAAEIGRITANTVAIAAPVVGGPASTALNSPRTPDVTVGAFTARVDQQIGGEGTFSITTAGKVRVTGTVTFANMGSDATVAIRGDEAVEILDAGRIALNGTNGPAGTLSLASRNIIASSTAALADFAAATSLTAISDRAGRNDGAVNDGGYLQAGGIRATLLNSTLIILNTGASTTTGNGDFAGLRGFTVGAAGFTVIQGGTNPVRVAINGRQVITATTATGTSSASGFTTGIDLIPLITFVPSGQSGTPFTFPLNGATAAQIQAAAAVFDPLSTVNGCTIVASSSCGNPLVVDDPIRDVLAGDFGEGAVSNLLPVSIVQLKDYATAGDEPLIDEPVTGAGNDDLWSVDDSKSCDPAKEACK